MAIEKLIIARIGYDWYVLPFTTSAGTLFEIARDAVKVHDPKFDGQYVRKLEDKDELFLQDLRMADVDLEKEAAPPPILPTPLGATEFEEVPIPPSRPNAATPNDDDQPF